MIFNWKRNKRVLHILEAIDMSIDDPEMSQVDWRDLGMAALSQYLPEYLMERIDRLLYGWSASPDVRVRYKSDRR